MLYQEKKKYRCYYIAKLYLSYNVAVTTEKIHMTRLIHMTFYIIYVEKCYKLPLSFKESTQRNKRQGMKKHTR